eukprot:scaffold105402_cov15-Tisochrysis_lutea.AAC.1
MIKRATGASNLHQVERHTGWNEHKASEQARRILEGGPKRSKPHPSTPNRSDCTYMHIISLFIEDYSSHMPNIS